ncbi:MAG: hypothetical protein DMF84_18210 [Acidobacteria bacterium]|nr:MAG: hypothetical protein DMF84_18210 [Acidobacteriota bacterium]
MVAFVIAAGAASVGLQLLQQIIEALDRFPAAFPPLAFSDRTSVQTPAEGRRTTVFRCASIVSFVHLR